MRSVRAYRIRQEFPYRRPVILLSILQVVISHYLSSIGVPKNERMIQLTVRKAFRGFGAVTVVEKQGGPVLAQPTPIS
jgi:hypothetical protein